MQGWLGSYGNCIYGTTWKWYYNSLYCHGQKGINRKRGKEVKQGGNQLWRLAQQETQQGHTAISKLE